MTSLLPDAARDKPAGAEPVAVIGGGHMARSLVGGLLKRGWPAASIAVAEPLPAARAALADDFRVRVFADNAEAARCATTWVLAVKPQSLPEACAPLATLAAANLPLVISIAAGVPMARLAGWLGAGVPIVRCMPNLPARIGAGVTGLVANAIVAPGQVVRAEALLAALGATVWLDDEAQMDAVTALSGTGPAYLFLLAEAMQAAGEAQGLDAGTARALTVQTLHGSARLLAAETLDAAALRVQVTSPGGTTEAAMAVFEAGGFRPLVGAAIAAATRRGGELAAALSPPVAEVAP
jgi:pyrroline-5-carboxylate reductase